MNSGGIFEYSDYFFCERKQFAMSNNETADTLSTDASKTDPIKLIFVQMRERKFVIVRIQKLISYTNQKQREYKFME